MLLGKFGTSCEAIRHHNPGNHNLNFIASKALHITDSARTYWTLCKISNVLPPRICVLAIFDGTHRHML
jgi:hypothetical protein